MDLDTAEGRTDGVGQLGQIANLVKRRLSGVGMLFGDFGVPNRSGNQDRGEIESVAICQIRAGRRDYLTDGNHGARGRRSSADPIWSSL